MNKKPEFESSVFLMKTISCLSVESGANNEFRIVKYPMAG